MLARDKPSMLLQQPGRMGPLPLMRKGISAYRSSDDRCWRKVAVHTQTASNDERDPVVMSPLGPPFMR